MLKITKAEHAGQKVKLKLEGRIAGPWVAELRAVCKPQADDGSRLALDLTDVSFADDDGVALLASFQQQGVRFLNMTPFLQEQLKPAAQSEINRR